MIKFALGVSLTTNVVLGGLVAGVILGAHTPEGANIMVLYLKKRGYLAERA